MGMRQKLLVLAGAAIAATGAGAQPAGQKVTGPVAVYWMSASTQTGIGMPGAGGASGKRPSMMQMMRMVTGSGGAQHSLTLQLGSSTRPQASPQAEHLPPQGLAIGDSIPLVTPEVQQSQPVQEERSQIPREYQRPKGKLLVFWGCGEHAPPNQPVVLDFSDMTPEKMAAGKLPPGLEALGRGMSSVRAMQPPSQTRFATYGDWPNSQDRKAVTPASSLVGQHTVRGDYSPQIQFTLDQSQDFLGPLTLTNNIRTASGAVQLAWTPVAGAEAYGAIAVGASEQDTVVIWSSSETGAAAFAMPDYIAPAELSRLVTSRGLMGPQTTSCTVPREAADAARAGFVQLVAYGREANFFYPPRPANPKVAWNQEWQVKVRYRSATGGLLGMTTPGMGGRGDRSAPQQQTPAEAAAARRRAILNGIGGLIPH